MAPESGVRRRQLLLAAVVIALGVVLYAVWPRPTAPVVRTSNTRGAARQTPGGGSISAPDVHLEELDADRPKPDGVDRNLFRFRTAPVEPKPPAPPPVEQQAPPKPVVPPAPTTQTIPLRFIGVLKMPNGRLQAILSDDRRVVYYGFEGAEIDGRYRILRITEDTIEMAYLDGRGRQTFRLPPS
jgi:hypothetical protein